MLRCCSELSILGLVGIDYVLHLIDRSLLDAVLAGSHLN